MSAKTNSHGSDELFDHAAAYSRERTADRVINICERIVYMVEGEVIDLDMDALCPFDHRLTRNPVLLAG